MDYEAKAAEVTGLTCIAGQGGMRFVARRKLHNWKEDEVRLRYARRLRGRLSFTRLFELCYARFVIREVVDRATRIGKEGRKKNDRRS